MKDMKIVGDMQVENLEENEGQGQGGGLEVENLN